MNSKIIGAVIAVMLIVAGVYYFAFYSGDGTLKVMLKDPMGAGWSAVYIQIEAISVHNTTAGGGAGFFTSFSAPKTVNLANVTNTSGFLTDLKLPQGHYEMIRLAISGAYGVYDGKKYSITVTTGSVDIPGQFRISSSSTTVVVLDFNSAAAIHGNPLTGFSMTPDVSMTVG